MWNLNKPQPAYKQAISQRRVLLTAFIAILLTTISININADSEGIKVHGDWIITVTNADGSVAQEVRFSNALAPFGPQFITQILIGNYTMGIRPDSTPAWDIRAMTIGTSSASECLALTDANGGPASVNPRNASVEDGNVRFTLRRNLVLTADCLTGANYSITGVRTQIGINLGTFGVFTEKVLSSPVTGILPNQVVTLQVTISFE